MTIKNILFFLTIGLLNFCCTANSQSVGQDKPNKAMKAYKIGSTAADFEMKNVDGKLYSLSSIEEAKGYIVIFTSNVCPFAVGYEDRIIDLHNRMAPKGYPVVAINSNDPNMEEGDSYDDMVIRHGEKKFPFLYLKDDKDAVYGKFGANKTPHVFLLDKEHVVRYIGAIDDNAKDASQVEERYVENAIAALESGQSPDPATTKAIGCPIKAKSNNGDKGRGERRGPPSPENVMERMDANNDKKISKDEAKGPLAGDFDNLDKDNDGMLTLEELSSMKKGKRGPRK